MKNNPYREEIYRFLLSGIADGEIAPGDKIPTEMELAERFQTNRSNVHLAIKRLENEGVVHRRKRLGTFVKKVLPQGLLDNFRSSNKKNVHVLLGTARNEKVHWNESALSSLEEYLRQNGYSLIYREFPKNIETFTEICASAEKDGSRALFILPGGEDEHRFMQRADLALSEYHSEVYLYNRGACATEDFGENLHVLYVDPYQEGLIAGRYLIERGYKPLAFLKTYKKNPYWVLRRIDGLRDALKETFGKKALLTVLETEEKNFDSKTDDFIKGSKGTPAFVAQADPLSANFIDSIAKKDLTPKRDYGIISFGNNPDCWKYNLTTIAPPCEKMCRILGEIICQSTWQSTCELNMKIALKPTLIERGTC